MVQQVGVDMVKYDKQGKKKTVNKKTTTKYDGTIPDKLRDHLAKGATIPEFCRLERISRQTLDNWCENYPDCKEARIEGKLWAEGWWLEQAREHLVTETIKTTDEDGNSMTSSKKFDSNLYKFYVGGRFGHTGDKALRDFIDEMNKRFDSLPKTTSAVAEEPAFTEEPSDSKS
jgi:hypothetical protein